MVATSAAVVVDQRPAPSLATASTSTAPDVDPATFSSALGESVPEVSRSAERAPLAAEMTAPKAKGERFVAADGTVVRTDHAGASPAVVSLDAGDTVEITGVKEQGWAQIVHRDRARWVPADQLSTEDPTAPKPEPEPEPEEAPSTEATEPSSTSSASPSGGSTISGAPCAVSAGVESGLMPDTVRVYRDICAKFAEVTSYGGVAPRGEHATGQALDIMISSDTGTTIAEYLRANHARFGIDYIIWRQQIWSVQRSAEGWRPMSDRGSLTANHMDHVHVTTYGSSGTG